MLVVGLALLATSIVALWLCLPSRQSGVKPFLRGASVVLTAIIIIGCFGAASSSIAGIAR